LEAARLERCQVTVVDRPELLAAAACESLPELHLGLRQSLPSAPAIAAFDLESVLVPEIWETVAQVTGVGRLALTTRNIADYSALMRERIQLCRGNGLTLARLRDIVGSMRPLPGAVEFLAWVQERMLAVIVSDTFHELAGPIVEKLGCSLMVCNGLIVDKAGYIMGHRPHHELGKAGAVAHFQRLGFQVLAVGDSFNDLTMLKTANAGILFRPCCGLLESAGELPVVWSFQELKAEMHKCRVDIP
jgi:phosphoserine/homoserine phosphotransferase